MQNLSRIARNDHRNGFAAVASETQAGFTVAFEEHRADRDIIDPDAQLGSRRQIDLSDA